jgi:DNA primase
MFDTVDIEAFTHPAYTAVRGAIAAAGGTSAGIGGAEWVSRVTEHTEDLTLQALVHELAAEPLPVKSVDGIQRFVVGVIARTQEAWVGRQVAELKSKLQRISSTEEPDAYMSLFGDVVALEQYRKSLRDQAMGNSGDFAAG